MEKKSKVNNDNFIMIQGFMLSDLHLKGNELLIYGIIHGFSHLEGQRFNGGLQYLCDWTSSTKQGVMNCLKSLESKGLIKKDEKIIQGVKFCEYHTTKLNTPYNKVEYPHATKFTTPIQQSLPNSIDKSIKESIIDNKEEISKEILERDLENEKLRLEIERLNQALEEKNKKVSTKGGATKPKKVSWLDLKEMELPEIYNEEEFRETWQSWCDFKHSRKESFTEKGIEIWFKKLETLSSRDLSISIQIVNESIANNWQGIFELKNQKSYAASKSNSQKSTTPYGAIGGVNSQGRGMFLIPLDDSTESSQGNDCIEVEGFYQSEL